MRTVAAAVVAVGLVLSASAHATTNNGCDISKIKGGQAHLFLYPTGAVTNGDPGGSKSGPQYIGDNADPWLAESWFQKSGDTLHLTIANEAKHGDGDVMLVIAVPGTLTSADLASLSISGGAGGTQTITFDQLDHGGNNPFTAQGSHGVYLPSGNATYAFYDVGPIAAGDTHEVVVQAVTSGGDVVKVHFDAYDCGNGDTNAFSSDLDWLGPGCDLTLTCPAPVSVECANGQGVVQLPAPTVTTTCLDAPTISSQPAPPYPYSCAAAPQTVTFTACTDEQTATCTSSVTVVDTTAPNVSCSNQTLVADASCHATASIGSANDGCQGNLAVTCDQTVFGLGSSTQHCSATDCANNRGTCNATIQVVDKSPPSISCSGDGATVECAGPCATPSPAGASASDNCSSAPTVLCDHTTLCLGDTPVKCTATDGSQNSASCQATVHVIDTQPPTIACATSAPVVVSTSSQGGSCAASLPVSATATDTCDGSAATMCSASLLSLTAPGTVSATCGASDQSCNVAMCTQTLTLVDDTPPSLSCPPPVTVTADEQCHGSVDLVASAHDNCDGPVSASCTPGTIALTAPGVVSATCHATDAAGNAAVECSTSVTMVDTSAPEVAFAAGGTICNDAPAQLPFSVHDNCGCYGAITASAGTVSFDPATGTGAVTLPAGTTSVTLTVEDCAHNQRTVSTSVTTKTCFCTYTQGAWHNDCHGGNIGCTLAQSFATVYPSPNYLYLGSAPPGSYWLQFTKAATIAAFLPHGGPSTALTGNAVDPKSTKSYGGTLAGQTAALHLNCDFDAKGLLARIAPVPLCSLIVTRGPFAGQTVRALLDLADSALAGHAAGVSLSDLNDALDSANNNFDGCAGNAGFLARP